jgi:hypothetical protein
MPYLSTVRTRTKSFWKWVLESDNILIGAGLCFFALYDWISFYDQIDRTSLYFAQGIVGLPSLNILSVLSSAIYLTAASLILLSLRGPLSRYETALPNLLALLAGFGVYMFTLIPGGNVLHASAYVARCLGHGPGSRFAHLLAASIQCNAAGEISGARRALLNRAPSHVCG